MPHTGLHHNHLIIGCEIAHFETVFCARWQTIVFGFATELWILTVFTAGGI